MEFDAEGNEIVAGQERKERLHLGLSLSVLMPEQMNIGNLEQLLVQADSVLLLTTMQQKLDAVATSAVAETSTSGEATIVSHALKLLYLTAPQVTMLPVAETGSVFQVGFTMALSVPEGKSARAVVAELSMDLEYQQALVRGYHATLKASGKFPAGIQVSVLALEALSRVQRALEDVDSSTGDYLRSLSSSTTVQVHVTYRVVVPDDGTGQSQSAEELQASLEAIDTKLVAENIRSEVQASNSGLKSKYTVDSVSEPFVLKISAGAIGKVATPAPDKTSSASSKSVGWGKLMQVLGMMGVTGLISLW